ncbi:Intradiol ring-cleavage dioxygenase [Ilyonectria sp. MPI-CAGE-AT-0026]|nr:Intradiol ring-cleavage dioxygenase [Ilyonectria sp. MPI-CAGE-AT-0026]
MIAYWTTFTLSLALQATLGNAHGIPDGKYHSRSLAHCGEVLEARGLTQKVAAQRAEMVAKERKKRNLNDQDPHLKARSFYSSLATNHNVTYAGYTPGTNPAELFSNYDDSCLLAPQATYGPYYVAGELVRSDIAEDQEGIPMLLQLQFIDSKTCEPVTGVYADIWHADSAGDYSGVTYEDVSADNINATFFRGIQPTDHHGLVHFHSMFPGHYPLRATHVHVMIHNNATVHPNKTLELNSGNIAHVGQVFFDQDLINLADTISPYSENTNTMVKNSEDGIFYVEAEVIDPVTRYTFLGDSLEKGIMAWMVFGIDLDANYNDVVQAASYYGKDGGESNANYNLTKLGPLEQVPTTAKAPTTFTATISV